MCSISNCMLTFSYLYSNVCFPRDTQAHCSLNSEVFSHHRRDKIEHVLQFQSECTGVIAFYSVLYRVNAFRSAVCRRGELPRMKGGQAALLPGFSVEVCARGRVCAALTLSF